MSARLAIVAGPAAASVAALEGSFPWGEARVSAPGTAPDAELVVALAEAGPEPAGAAGQRVIAPTGEGLWSRAAWPVRDELFELDPPDPAADLLVVTSHEELHAGLVEKLTGRGIRLRTARELTADALAECAAVAFPPVWEDGGVAIEADVTGREDMEQVFAQAAELPGGGPLGIVDVVGMVIPNSLASADDEVVQYADALQAFPDVFVPLIALGRIAAERQRASTVYGRLVAELATAAPRSAAPRG